MTDVPAQATLTKLTAQRAALEARQTEAQAELAELTAQEAELALAELTGEAEPGALKRHAAGSAALQTEVHHLAGALKLLSRKEEAAAVAVAEDRRQAAEDRLRATADEAAAFAGRMGATLWQLIDDADSLAALEATAMYGRKAAERRLGRPRSAFLLQLAESLVRSLAEPGLRRKGTSPATRQAAQKLEGPWAVLPLKGDGLEEQED